MRFRNAAALALAVVFVGITPALAVDLSELTDDIGLGVANGAAGQVGSVSLLPPTTTAQYHFDPTGWIHPYIGAGAYYTFFYDAHSPLPDIHHRNVFGWALQAGTDVPVGDGPYFLNVDAKKLFLNTSIDAARDLVHAHADLNPLLIGGGVGMRS